MTQKGVKNATPLFIWHFPPDLYIRACTTTYYPVFVAKAAGPTSFSPAALLHTCHWVTLSHSQQTREYTRLILIGPEGTSRSSQLPQIGTRMPNPCEYLGVQPPEGLDGLSPGASGNQWAEPGSHQALSAPTMGWLSALKELQFQEQGK